MLVVTSGKCRAALFHLDVDTVVPLLLPALTSVVPHCFTSLRRLLLNALWFGLVTLVWFGGLLLSGLTGTPLILLCPRARGTRLAIKLVEI